MAPRSRILAFGTAAALVLAGGACAALVSGIVGEVLTLVLISGGLAAGLLLIFLEIGLEEERDLEREQASRRERERRLLLARRRLRLRRPRRQ